jgi:hypothetical protein
MKTNDFICMIHPERKCPIFDETQPGCPAALFAKEQKMWFCSLSVMGMSMARHFFGANHFSAPAAKSCRDKKQKTVARLIKI